jgi:hypothetical protein
MAEATVSVGDQRALPECMRAPMPAHHCLFMTTKPLGYSPSGKFASDDRWRQALGWPRRRQHRKSHRCDLEQLTRYMGRNGDAAGVGFRACAVPLPARAPRWGSQLGRIERWHRAPPLGFKLAGGAFASASIRWRASVNPLGAPRWAAISRRGSRVDRDVPLPRQVRSENRRCGCRNG